MIKVLVISAVALALTSCSVYRSPDRDYFDDNGRSGAPTTAAAFYEFDAHPSVPNGDVSLSARLNK